MNYWAVMALQNGREVRVSSYFNYKIHKAAVEEIRGHADTLGLRFIEPPAPKRPLMD